MPRSRNALGRPGTQVIPTDWAASHRPVIEDGTGVMTVTIAWRRPGGTAGAFNPTTLAKTVTPPSPHYTGPADMQLVTQLQQEKILDEDDRVTTVGYRVTVNGDAATGGTDFEVGDRGTVLTVTDNADASVLGKVVTVVAIERPAHGWERYLLCTENLG